MLNLVAAVGGIAPVAGLGGEHTAVPVALLMTVGAALSMVGLVYSSGPGDERTR